MPAELVALAEVLLAAFVTLAGHEVGHVLGGKAGGLRLALLIVGPVHVQRGADGRLHWQLNRRLAFAGGVASCVVDGPTDLRRAYMRMVAGGPLASLGLGVLALALLVGTVLVGPATHRILAHPAALGLLIVTAGSLSIGLGTLIPINVSGFLNDGARVLQLWRPGPKAERHAAVMALSSYYVAGLRPRDWGPALIREVVSLPDGSYDDAWGHYLAYLHAVDRGDLEEAEAHVRAMLAMTDTVPEAFRPVIEIEAAYFGSAYGRLGNLDLKRPEEVEKSPFVEARTRERAGAAVLLAEGQTELARAKLSGIYGYMARNEGLDESAFIMAEIERLCRHWGLPQPKSPDGKEARTG
jgi:hypothetical protein